MVTDFERGMELGERVARLVRERNDAIDKLKEQTGAHERCKEALREANETISALQESLARHERDERDAQNSILDLKRAFETTSKFDAEKYAKIQALESQLREANETISALQESLARHERGTEVRADGKEVRKDRWEQAFRAISSRFIGCREEFEVEPLTRDILAVLDKCKAEGTLREAEAPRKSVSDAASRKGFDYLVQAYEDAHPVSHRPVYYNAAWHHPDKSRPAGGNALLCAMDYLYPNGAPEGANEP